MSLARPAAALVAATALGALGWQYLILGGRPGMAEPLVRLWDMARYYTLLTNALTGITFALIALHWPPREGWLGGIVLAVGMVGGIYHTLLVPGATAQGAEYWTDLAFHTLVPLGALVWWLVWGKQALRFGQVPGWLIWPVGYGAYALLRGAIEGQSPYFFLDINRFGAARVGLYLLLLGLGFTLAGLALVALSRILRGNPAPAAS